MLYYDFKNYDEFKQIFGIIEHGNGVKSRKNKVLLALYKDKSAFKALIKSREYESLKAQIGSLTIRSSKKPFFAEDSAFLNALRNKKDGLYGEELILGDFLYATSFTDLKKKILSCMSCSAYRVPGAVYEMNLGDYVFFSDSYETDSLNGLCEDGTLNAIRYRNIERGCVFKMKAGKMFKHLISCNTITKNLPEEVRIMLTEDFVAEWIEYSRQNIGTSEYKLHVDDNFADIYDSYRCPGGFGSCMTDGGVWTFYRDAVEAKAAYLTDSDGNIVARCVIYTEVKDEDGKTWRLAERQYSKGKDLSIQRQLIAALIRDGHIDGYKRVGASCSDSRGFLDVNGESLSDKRFTIACSLEPGDNLSYQDSFKWFNYFEQVADNYGKGNEELDITDGRFRDNRYYSEYNDEYLDEDEAYYVETRSDYFRSDQVVYAQVRNGRNGCYHEEDCFEGDCIQVGGDYYYAGTDAEDPEAYGIYECPVCGEYFICSEQGVYSELTDEYYCCDDCTTDAEKQWREDNGYKWSEYDEDWYNEDDVLVAKQYNSYLGKFVNITIHVDSFNEFVDSGEASVFNGDYYLDGVNYEGEPSHAAAYSAA